MSAPEDAEEVARAIIEVWTAAAFQAYDPEDLERGHIEVADRRNRIHRFPAMTVSIGIASTAVRPIDSHWEAAQIASELKGYAKRRRGSSYELDRRRR